MVLSTSFVQIAKTVLHKSAEIQTRALALWVFQPVQVVSGENA